MNKALAIIINVISRRNYFILFIVSSFLYGIIYAIMTNLIDIRLGLKNINISFTIVSGIFFIIFSILGGLFLTLLIFSIKNKQKSLSYAHSGFMGTLISFTTTICPFCKPLLLSLIGFSSSLTILKYGLALAIFSILLLLVSIYLLTSSLDKSNCCFMQDKNVKK